MQTFLPYESFEESAKSLDRQRIGKQRVENLQIMKALAGESKGWANHPAVRMWRGHELALMLYQKAICDEWNRRGYKDTCFDKTFEVYEKHFQGTGTGQISPPWLGRADFHKSHRLNLMRKDPIFYAFFEETDDPSTAEYIWPV